MAASMTTTNPASPQESEQFVEVLEDFSVLDVFQDEDLSVKRKTCDRCRRPIPVCLCPFLPNKEIQIKTKLFILQHPFEESRCLRTVPILQNSIPSDNCIVMRGKRFPNSKFPELRQVFESPDTLLLYPGKDAVDIQDLPCDKTYNLVLLDGTWSQAKGIYNQNPFLADLKKVQIQIDEKSKYVIRTQPCDSALSTLESAAIAISTLEQRPELAEIMIQPLVALCDFQIQHGASEHQSREYKISNGLWTKPLSKSVQRRLDEKKREHVIS